MKKFIFTLIAAIAVMCSANVFVSCASHDGDSHDINPETNPRDNGYVYGVKVVITENMAKYGDWTYTITNGTETTTYNIAKDGNLESANIGDSNGNDSIGKVYVLEKYVGPTKNSVSGYASYTSNDLVKSLTNKDEVTWGYAHVTGKAASRSNIKLSYNVYMLYGMWGDHVLDVWNRTVKNMKF